MKYLKVSLIFIFLFLVSALVGFKLTDNIKETDIYLEGDIYTFRDAEGHKISAIEKDGVIYLPVIDDFLFLDYSVSRNDDRIDLTETVYPDNVDLNTETLDGDLFTTESLFDY